MAPRASKQDAPASAGAQRVVTDPRFANLTTDPRYRPPSRKHTHVNIDKRFAHMLRDDDFSAKANVDRYGRRIPKGSGKKKLERMYRVQDEDGEDGNEVDGDDEVRGELARLHRKHDPARDGGFSESSSSESDEQDSSSSSEDEDELDAAIEAGLKQGDGERHEAEAVPMGEVSSRIAVVNLDWDKIRAVDLMAVATSFCPPDGRVTSVSIYPSEFGKDRMEREELEGPPKELFVSKKSKHGREATHPMPIEKANATSLATPQDVDDDEIKKSLLAHAAAPEPEIDSRALRTYQLSRLRYFYGIITCSSPSTAHALYTDMDGREYLSTANFFDLRFVPDDITFDDKARDACHQVPEGYRPQDFVTAALRHSTVRLTWDEDDQGRKEVQKKAFGKQEKGKAKNRAAEIDENDLRAYIGNDSDSSDADSQRENAGVPGETGQVSGELGEPKISKSEQARRKMREALGLSVDGATTGKSAKAKHTKAKDSSAAAEVPAGNMQITFSAGLTAAPRNPDTSIFQNEPPENPDETTREKYIRKERERKARRKAKRLESQNGVVSDDEDATAAGAIKPLASATGEEDNDEADAQAQDPFNDPFFTDPVSANAAARKEAKRAKREATAADAAATAEKQARERAQLELLMDDDDRGARKGGLAGSGFDMAAVRKAEKEAARKGKGKKGKGRKSKGESGIDNAGDDFELDVADPRFSGVYENHEFAIDPSNPRFSGTKGMQRLLEEGRRKRRGGQGAPGLADREDVGLDSNGAGAAVGAVDGGAVSRGGEVHELVRKIKRRRVQG